MARVATAGLAANAAACVDYSKGRLGDVDLTACMAALEQSVQRVQQGDLGDAEALLMSQAITLNAVFTELTRRAHTNMSDAYYFEAAERYLRLAFKAQGQSRATLETLAAVKNGPSVFARQANIAHGPQQVNNGVALAPSENRESTPDKLLETHGERLDSGASGPAVTRDCAMATVGTFDGSTDRRGQGAIGAKCRPRRTASEMA